MNKPSFSPSCSGLLVAIAISMITPYSWSQEQKPRPIDAMAVHCAGLAKIEAVPNPGQLATMPPKEVRKIILRHTTQLIKKGALEDAASCLSTIANTQKTPR